MFKPYKGLTDADIKHVQSVYPDLHIIQEYTGVPWQAMAGIWYRESFSVASPETPGGPWQFDPVPSPGALRGLLDRFTKLDPDSKKSFVYAGVDHFGIGGIFAACWLRLHCKPIISLNSPDEDIKDAIYGYNGRKYGSADQSPYVMNGFDSAHYPMHLRGTLPDGHGGRKKVDTMDERPGAFTVYKQLKALFP
jgi:hypothetical protein